VQLPFAIRATILAALQGKTRARFSVSTFPDVRPEPVLAANEPPSSLS
jgi:hypothetical protein